MNDSFRARRATRRTSRAAAGLTALALAATGVVTQATPSAAAGVTVTNGCVRSVPEPGTTEKVKICWTMFKPAGASKRHKVPFLMHSHGWGGERSTKVSEFRRYLDAGFGVLSFDQRGFGASGGKAHVENPDYEGHDVRKLVSLIAKQPWVRKDAPGDPRLGAIGGSYGGGYQFLGAFEELRVHGKPIFDALVPEITWYDLKESLAPSEVVRTEWAAALAAASLPSDALPQEIFGSLAEGAALGSWPAGTTPGTTDLDRFFLKNGPKWHVSKGRRLDIPVLFGQGATDNLFPLQQGLTNWAKALTPRARKRSIFVGYNGGHTLPSVFPAGVGVEGDPCSRKLGSPDFAALGLRFLQETLQGKDRKLRGFNRFHLATVGNTCTQVSSVAPSRTFSLPDITTTAAVGVPQAVEVAKGPIRVAGRTFLSSKVTTMTPDARAFFGLAVGASPLDAKVVQNNLLPLALPSAVSGAKRRVELPSVAVNVPKGQRLYLVTTPVADMFLTHGSRVPGVLQLQDVKLELPVVR